MGSGASKRRQTKNSALGSVFNVNGIQKVVLIRHANSQPRDPKAVCAEFGEILKPDTPFANAWTVGDLTRQLTDKGREQAKQARDAWFGELQLRAVISSEATRAIATKDIMTNDNFPEGSIGNLTLHTLHPSRSNAPECEKMFDKLG